jgi:hypothetical protein
LLGEDLLREALKQVPEVLGVTAKIHPRLTLGRRISSRFIRKTVSLVRHKAAPSGEKTFRGEGGVDGTPFLSLYRLFGGKSRLRERRYEKRTLSRPFFIGDLPLGLRLTRVRFDLVLRSPQKGILEKFEDCMNEMHGITERDAFSYGFRPGVQRMAESFLLPLDKEKNG